MEAANSARPLPYILTTCPLPDASPPTGRCAYHLLSLRRRSGGHLGQTRVAGPIRSITIGIRLLQSCQVAALSRGRRPNPPQPPLPMRPTPSGPPGLKNKSILSSLEGRHQAGSGPPQSAAHAAIILEVLPSRWVDLDEVRGRLWGANERATGDLRSSPSGFGAAVCSRGLGCGSQQTGPRMPRRGRLVTSLVPVMRGG
ncbi:hypothetical protein Cgig2_033958 [Carnegiea gigantea]|uniref:Uncharacterized protein n=1 Tax=Carnegiea gigantea TaxID=171969 RepID=A0A9Q1KE39_9CARY|nr:hypothetical protein Cgig2_033958 [Carnegiea gigantea]